MLHIYRRPHQSIFIEIDERIVKITTWLTPTGQVKFAIHAPRDITVVREELVQTIKKNN